MLQANHQNHHRHNQDGRADDIDTGVVGAIYFHLNRNRTDACLMVCLLIDVTPDAYRATTTHHQTVPQTLHTVRDSNPT